MLNDNLFVLMRKMAEVKTPIVTDVDLSNNKIISEEILPEGLQMFFQVTSLTLKNCNIQFSSFALPTSFLLHLDLSQNQIEEVTSKIISSVSSLKTLILSKNSIKQISMDLLGTLKDLRISDLSYNSITHITSTHSLSNALINLIVHNLQRNYIFEISRNVFPLPLLESLHHLDLHYNSIECSCDLSENFGRWLSQRAYYLSDRPGILPRCSYSVGNFGGCVKCTTAKQEDRSLLQQSLLQYSTNSFCSSTTIIIYTASFTTFCLLLLVCLLTAEKACFGRQSLRLDE